MLGHLFMILNQQYLRNIANRNNFRMDSIQTRVLFENKSMFTSKTVYDIFISHSYLDKELIIRVCLLSQDSAKQTT